MKKRNMLKKYTKAEIEISGMTCATCAITIKNSLLNLNGVANVGVNLGNENALVEYDPTKVKLNDLKIFDAKMYVPPAIAKRWKGGEIREN